MATNSPSLPSSIITKRRKFRSAGHGFLKKGSNKSCSKSTLLSIKNFFSLKTGRNPQVNSQSKALKSIYIYPHLSHDKPFHASKAGPERRLIHKIGHKGRVSPYSSKINVPKVSSIQLQEPTLLLHSTPVRPYSCPIHFFKNNEIPHSNTIWGGSKTPCIPRRYNHLGILKGPTRDANSMDIKYIPEGGLSHQLEKVRNFSKTDYRMVRNKMEWAGGHIRANRKFPGEADHSGINTLPARSDITPSAARVPREVCICRSDNPRVQAPKSLPGTIPKKFCSISSTTKTTPTRGTKGGNSVVAQGFKGLKQTGTVPIYNNRPGNVDRCLKQRIWSIHRQGCQPTGEMESAARKPSYKCKRASCNLICNKIKSSSGRRFTDSLYRQYHSHALSQEYGIKSISHTPRNNSRPPEVFEKKKPQNSDLSCPRSTEYNSRCSVSPGSSSNRMDNHKERFSQNSHMEGGTRDRCNGRPLEYTASDLHFTSSSEGESFYGFLPNQSKQVDANLYFPSNQPTREGNEQAQGFQRSRGSGGPMVAQPAVVHSTDGNELTTHETIRSTQIPIQSERSQRTKDVINATRIQFLKDKLSTVQGQEVAEDIIHAYRQSTLRQHEIAWKALQDWLRETKEEVSKPAILRFLRHLFHNKKLAPNTVISYRAALSFPLSLGFEIDIHDKEFSLLARSQFLARPPQKRHIPQWDINRVLQLLQTEEYEYGSGIRNNILNKGIFILALASGSRTSELSAWYREGILWTDNEAAIIPVRPGFLFKNQRSKRAPPNMIIKPLREEELSHPLCPVRALRQVLALNTIEAPSAVFATATGRGLSRANIASRLCHVIEESCPGSFPRAHDVRKVAASIAWTRGVCPEEIIKRGFWSSYNTFIEHYLVPVNPLESRIVALQS